MELNNIVPKTSIQTTGFYVYVPGMVCTYLRDDLPPMWPNLCLHDRSFQMTSHIIWFGLFVLFLLRISFLFSNTRDRNQVLTFVRQSLYCPIISLAPQRLPSSPFTLE